MGGGGARGREQVSHCPPAPPAAGAGVTSVVSILGVSGQDRGMDGWTLGWMGARTDGCRDGWRHGWMDTGMDGWMLGWTGTSINGHLVSAGAIMAPPTLGRLRVAAGVAGWALGGLGPCYGAPRGASVCRPPCRCCSSPEAARPEGNGHSVELHWGTGWRAPERCTSERAACERHRRRRGAARGSLRATLTGSARSLAARARTPTSPLPLRGRRPLPQQGRARAGQGSGFPASLAAGGLCSPRTPQSGRAGFPADDQAKPQLLSLLWGLSPWVKGPLGNVHPPWGSHLTPGGAGTGLSTPPLGSLSPSPPPAQP